MKASYFFLLLLLAGYVQAQTDEEVIKAIYDNNLTESPAYENLRYLTKEVGARLSGTPQAASAVEYTRQLMESHGFDTVYLQPVMVPHWDRGEKEIVRMVSEFSGTVELSSVALGNSVGTGEFGLSAEVIEVQDFDELQKLGRKNIQGKIVFFNRPFDYTLINTFAAYSGAVNQRGAGAVEAAKLGAISVVVRSMASQVDDVPHTGSLRYNDEVNKIPGVAISTVDADLLSQTLKMDPGLRLFIRTTSGMKKEEPSFNVIGQINGSEFPDEIIVIGGHLDSWDVGEGAHDDGGGCIQSIEVLRTFRSLGLKPKRTLRAVMYMNEENGLRGGTQYAIEAERLGEKHLAAIESDRGVFTPKGFTIVDDEVLTKIQTWAPLFHPYGVREFIKGGGGADIGPLRSQGTKLIGFYPDSQRYFTLHHTAADVFETVDKRELELGSATIASLVYLIDKYGL